MKCEQCGQEIENDQHTCQNDIKELSPEIKELLRLDQIADTMWDMLYHISDKR